MGSPGMSNRAGISLKDALKLFSDESQANEWFVQRRWPNGVACFECGSLDCKPYTSRRLTPAYQCKDCRKVFTVKTGTIMHHSRLPLSTWGLAFYLLTTNLKGVSSMKLHRDLGVTQKTAWHLAHRIRETMSEPPAPFAGPVQMDETYIGGKFKNQGTRKVGSRGRGAVDKIAVVGVKDEATNQVVAKAVKHVNQQTILGILGQTVKDGIFVWTDEAQVYKVLRGLFFHGSVNHSSRQYKHGKITTNSIESFWSMLKKGYHGTYHYWSPKHLQRYLNEFTGRHNVRPLDTATQLALLVKRGVGRRLPYKQLINRP